MELGKDMSRSHGIYANPFGCDLASEAKRERVESAF
jgi:hypothetical protein